MNTKINFYLFESVLNMPKVYNPSYRSSEEFGPYDAGYGAFSTNYFRGKNSITFW